MKIALVSTVLAFLAIATLSLAQERVETEEAQRIAHKLNDTIGNPSDAPFLTEVDPEKPNGFKVREAGFMVLPDRRVAGKLFENVGLELVPLGQLWSLNISLAVSGHALPTNQIRLVSVGETGQSRDVQLYYLAARKDAAGQLQLVIFAKDPAQPVLTVPINQVPTTSPATPIDLTGRQEGEESGLLTIGFLGEYAAEIPVTKPE